MGARARKQKNISIYISLHMKTFLKTGVYICIYIYIYIANFLNTNLTKFAVILVKKPQKALFSSPTSPKIIATKEKKRKGGEEKKKQWLHS